MWHEGRPLLFFSVIIFSAVEMNCYFRKSSSIFGPVLKMKALSEEVDNEGNSGVLFRLLFCDNE